MPSSAVSLAGLLAVAVALTVALVDANAGFHHAGRDGGEDCPDDQSCSLGCCTTEGYLCCPDPRYCAANINDCPGCAGTWCLNEDDSEKSQCCDDQNPVCCGYGNATCAASVDECGNACLDPDFECGHECCTEGQVCCLSHVCADTDDECPEYCPGDPCDGVEHGCCNNPTPHCCLNPSGQNTCTDWDETNCQYCDNGNDQCLGDTSLNGDCCPNQRPICCGGLSCVVETATCCSDVIGTSCPEGDTCCNNGSGGCYTGEETDEDCVITCDDDTTTCKPPKKCCTNGFAGCYETNEEDECQ